jgi:predicted outer membrane repeat protein
MSTWKRRFRTAIPQLLSIAVIAVSLLPAGARAEARVWLVPAEAPTIQAGIDSCSTSFVDTVLVACGTYYEHQLVPRSDMVLRSEAGLAGCVIIDAQGLGRVFECNGLSGTRIEGFIIKGGDTANSGGGMVLTGGGAAPVSLVNCLFTHNDAGSHGGGLFIESSSPVLVGCSFRFNQANRGGGFAADGFDGFLDDCNFNSNESGYGGGLHLENASPEFEGCTISGNLSDIGGGYYGFSGVPTFTDCLIMGNHCTYEAAGMKIGTALFYECVFNGNWGGGAGGGIKCGDFSDFTLCTFKYNEALQGAGVYCRGPNVNFSYCDFIRNVATTDGGGIFADTCIPILSNCTFFENGAGLLGGGLYLADDSQGCLDNCLVAFSVGEAVHVDATSEATWIMCCDLFGNSGGDWTGTITDRLGIMGNISEDPQFCPDEYPFLTIAASSPCATENHPECWQIGSHGVGCDLTAAAGSPGGDRLAMSSFPNPFIDRTTISFDLPSARSVKIHIYDITGRRLRELTPDAALPAGRSRVVWDGRDDNAAPLSAGVYLYSVEAAGLAGQGRMLLVK